MEDWVAYLETRHRSGPEDMLFPATRHAPGPDGLLRPAGLAREGWSSAGPIRKIFRSDFMAAGFPYYSPHRIRDILAAREYELCRTTEEIKAWSQNLGHADPMTTFSNYGLLASPRQGEIIRKIRAAPPRADEAVDQMQELLDKIRHGG